ncbi:MAG: HD domain-containing protein [Phycisphaerales bacterium]|nr:HD domain-containing protein [Phycisphaerales bacterium]
MKTIAEQVAACRAGRHPRLVARMPSGWLVLAPSQRLRGYCILLADPVVSSLNDLSGGARAQFLADMARAGDAVAAAVKPVRLNYEMLGNLDPTLHAHVVPRQKDEPESLRTKAIWLYPPEEWDAPKHAFNAKAHGPLREAIARALDGAPANAGHRPDWQDAAAMAARFHEGQVRKDGRTPYFSHPARVAMTVRDVFGCDDREALTAAFLHDVIEDTPADYDDVSEAFGDRVAEVVAALTKDMRLPEPEREPAYDAGLRAADWRAHVVKLADQYDNLSNAMRDGLDVDKFLRRCERAIAVAGEEGAWRPEVARAVEMLRELMALAAEPRPAGSRGRKSPEKQPGKRGKKGKG